MFALGRPFGSLSTGRSALTLLLYAMAFSEALALFIHLGFFGWNRIEHTAIISAVVVPVVATPLIVFCVWTIKRLDHSKNKTKATAAELDRRLAELERTQALWRKAESESSAKSTFLANMSHELRTPLNAIIGLSEMMEGELFGTLGHENYKAYASDIHGAGKHLLKIIADILDVSKVEAGAYNLHEEPVDVSSVIAACVGLVKVRATETGVAVVSSADEKLPLLFADERSLKQILLNLLSNAVKFSRQKGTVAVEAGVDSDGSIVIRIHDEGIGIAAGDMETVFSPFGQVDSVFAREEGGAGLGLPLAKALAELHGATLELSSRPGQGTTVSVAFPVERTVTAPLVCSRSVGSRLQSEAPAQGSAA